MGLGIAGTLTEIGRIKKADMKGLDDLIVGLLLTVVSVVVILKFRNVALNIGLFIVLLLGSYGMIRGILEILYSLKQALSMVLVISKLSTNIFYPIYSPFYSLRPL